MIDSGSPFNLLSQKIIAKHGISRDSKNIPPAQNLNKGGITLYQWHQMTVEITTDNNLQALDAVTIYGANIVGCNMILGILWL